MTNIRRLLSICALAAAFRLPLSAQTLPNPSLAPSFGTTDFTSEVISAWDMAPANSATTWSLDSITLQRYLTSGGYLVAGIHVPKGARIVYATFDACDTSNVGQVGLQIFKSNGSSVISVLASGYTGAAETPGCSRFVTVASAPIETADPETYTYTVDITHDTYDDTTSMGDIRIYYQLQVSPAPGTASFGDVPLDHPFFQFIEALASSGITAGCGGGNFCPDTPLTRGQMAVFLSKALGLHWPSAAPGP